jgi:hypothetical protein
MIDQLSLLWHFLRAQPPAQYVQLVSWHLLLVLAVLGVLSAFGLHFLVGYLFRFYRRHERHARWVSWPTLPVLLASVLALLGCYLLGVRSAELVRVNLTSTMTEQLGRLLLEPAFQAPVLAAHSADAVPKGALKAALRSASELDYRTALQERIADPAALAPATDGTGGARGPDVLVQMGLRWVTEPHTGWVAPTAPGGPDPAAPDAAAPERPPGAAETTFFLPDFLAALVDELPDDTVLPRLDWEHVAGTRFVDSVLRPLVEEYVSYLALALALLVLLADALYFLAMRRLKRIGQARAAKPAPKPAAKPAAKAEPKTAPPPATTAPALVPAAAPPAASSPAAAPVPAAPAADKPTG